ncbi:MAG: hypothetical protein K8R67_09570, partial [Desulfobacteraceae bacterium]|nr:hypothetical protein [Desulfobacteraceae bacterium]
EHLKARTGSIVIKNPKNKTSSVWKKNRSYSIKWDKFGKMPDTVRIILKTSTGTGPIHVIKKSSPNSGYLSWKIPESIAPGKYKIVINASKTDIRGFSNTFTITRELKAKPVNLSSKQVIVKKPKKNRKYAPGAIIPINWETDLHKEILNTNNSLYFDIALYDRNGVNKIYTIVKRKDFREFHLGGKRYGTKWTWNPSEANSAIKTGQYKIKITPKFADKDPCGMPGFSGRFNLSRGLKKVTQTLNPQIRNRHSLKMKSYTQDNKTLIKPPVWLEDQNKSQRARVGYRNSYSTNYTAYTYFGFIFRSQLIFPVDKQREEGKLLLKATLRLKVDGYSASYIHPRKATCAKALYYMTGPWSGKCTDTPGYLIKSIPDQSSLTMDITQFAQNWYTGSEPNHGLLFLSWDESFEHENIACLTWYKAELFLEYLRKVKN